MRGSYRAVGDRANKTAGSLCAILGRNNDCCHDLGWEQPRGRTGCRDLVPQQRALSRSWSGATKTTDWLPPCRVLQAGAREPRRSWRASPAGRLGRRGDRLRQIRDKREPQAAATTVKRWQHRRWSRSQSVRLKSISMIEGCMGFKSPRSATHLVVLIEPRSAPGKEPESGYRPLAWTSRSCRW